MREAVRRHRFAFALIALLVGVLFLPPLLKREVFTARDHTDYFQPLRFYTAVHIASFNLPYWNPYSASGEPWLANPQTGVFYPPTWLFMFLPFETAYMLYLALHLVVLGWGAYLLFTRSVTPGAAAVGAVAITFAGPVLSLIDVQNNLATFAWIPWVLWTRSARLAGILLALAFLGGEPFFAAAGAALYAIVRAVEGPMRPALRDVAIAALVAIGLSSIQLLPFLELLRGSDRAAGLPSEQIFRESMHPKDWLRVAVPPELSATGFDAALSQHFIPIVYVGMATALLAMLAWLFVRRRAVAGWSLLLATSAVVAAGSYLPTGRLFELLPLTLFRYPSRVVPFGALALAGLAVLAWDRFRPKHRWADLLLIAILLVDLVPRAAPILRTAPYGEAPLIYPEEVGRRAKMMRIHQAPLIDRAAWIAGYRNLYHRRFDAWTAAPVIDGRYEHLHAIAVDQRRFDLFQFLGIGFVLSDRSVAEPFVRAGHYGNVTVYRNAVVPPMAMLWPSWRAVESDDQALRAVIDAGMGGGLPVAGAPAPAGDSSAMQILPVETVSVGTGHARVVVNAPVASVLMITQQDAAGWDVYVDGEKKK
ncbi:MAG TPA: hypothetical protein VFT12_04180 [Thermoanaerobaculia bacterium]|nr:hypothetical protein [Thermoanaerobaculia bacterium]